MDSIRDFTSLSSQMEQLMHSSLHFMATWWGNNGNCNPLKFIHFSILLLLLPSTNNQLNWHYLTNLLTYLTTSIQAISKQVSWKGFLCMERERRTLSIKIIVRKCSSLAKQRSASPQVYNCLRANEFPSTLDAHRRCNDRSLLKFTCWLRAVVLA